MRCAFSLHDTLASATSAASAVADATKRTVAGYDMSRNGGASTYTASSTDTTAVLSARMSRSFSRPPPRFGGT